MPQKFTETLSEFIDEAIRERFKLFGLTIDGVEVTQAIQYWNAAGHLTDPADRGPDNSITLVADKPAYVRVYVSKLGDPLPGVIGTVTVQRPRYDVWLDAGTLSSEPPASVTARADQSYDAIRGSLSSSLNFLIPAAMMRGTMRLKVHVEAPGTDEKDDTELTISATLLQTLRIRGIPVQYWGPDSSGNQVQLAAPTLADFQSTASLALLLFPVSQTPVISLAGTFTWSEPLVGNITTSGGTSSCPTSWNDLLFWLGIAKTVDGNRADWMYFALLPNGIPLGNAAGCGGGGAVGAGFINVSSTMAHELGHVLGFQHAPCGLVSGDLGDPNYPAYEPYDTANNKQASIGEYGLDPTAPTVFSPATARDIMSYCSPRWISPYHYSALILHPLLDPQWVSGSGDHLPSYFDDRYRDPIAHYIPDPVPPWVGRSVGQVRQADPVPLVVVTGMLIEDRLEVRSVLRFATGPTSLGRRVADTFVETLNAQGEIIARAPLRAVTLQPACGCGCRGAEDGPASGLVQALLPEHESIRSLRVMRKETELWTRRATAEPPRIASVSAKIDGNEVTVRWETSTTHENNLERVVRWSADEGRTWQALAVLLRENRATVPITMFTCGEILVQVLVADGFHTTLSDPVRLEIPRRPPHVAIIWPAQGNAVKSGRRVRLWGMATACDGHNLPGEKLHWELDGQAAGTGTEVWAELAGWEGEHRATLRARDGYHTAEKTVTFFATCSGNRPVRLEPSS